MRVGTVDQQVRNPMGKRFVLPEPAPAITSNGPTSFVFPGLMPYSTASRCCGI